MPMEKNGSSSTMLIALGMILLAAFSRLIPHAPNFTAVTAMALFAGATLQNRWLGVLVPVLALAMTDFILGFYSGSLFVYIPFVLIALVSYSVLQKDFGPQSGEPNKKRWMHLAGFTLAASLFFFVVSNFGVWAASGMYTKDFQGLITCYLMALPFLGNQIAGDLFFSGALLLVFSWAKSSVAGSSRAL